MIYLISASNGFVTFSHVQPVSVKDINSGIWVLSSANNSFTAYVTTEEAPQILSCELTADEFIHNFRTSHISEIPRSATEVEQWRQFKLGKRTESFQRSKVKLWWEKLRGRGPINVKAS